jgi:hypothetical protein
MLELYRKSWADQTKFLQNTRQPVVLCIDTFLHRSIEKKPGHIYIFIQVEPESIYSFQQRIINEHENYDYILTFNEKILASCPNAHKYIYGTTWIAKDSWTSYKDTEAQSQKIFEITTLVGNKQSTDGHVFRKRLYLEQQKIPMPYRFFKSVRLPPMLQTIGTLYTFSNTSQEAKLELFEKSQFSIVIENCRMINYFTEKLCDCLITKTIPIYFGCPNIEDYFDTTGWIIVTTTSVDALSSALSTLTPEYYARYADIIDKNYETVQQYIDFYENVNRVLKNLPPFLVDGVC